MLNEQNLPYTEKETTVLFLRRHWIIPFEITLAHVALFALPLGIFLVFRQFILQFMGTNSGRAIVILSASLYFMFIWLLYFYAIIDYWLDVWIVTSKRILHIEEKGLFNREIAELELSHVQDVTSKVKGILPTLWGYGEIYIQTAAELPRFIFEDIPNPDLVQTKIMELVKKSQGSV